MAIIKPDAVVHGKTDEIIMKVRQRETSELGRSLEEGMATHSIILAWRIPMDREAWWATVHRVAELDRTEVT